MLTAVKNQIKVARLSIKYSIMMQMLNKMTFISNIVFMMLNNASMLIQWIILFSLKDNVGGYTFGDVLLLWGFAASTYGIAHVFFERAFSLSDMINDGALDTYLVQPKNVLISVITSTATVSAIGDIIYGLIMLFLYGFTIKRFMLFSLLSINGGLIIVSIAVIFSSLSFWFRRTDTITNIINSMMVNTATYPDGIFKGVVKILLYTLIPVGIVNYIPVKLFSEFNFLLLAAVIGIAILFITLAFTIFNLGLKKYSSSSLMVVRN